MSLYRAYFVPGSEDPTGKQTLSTDYIPNIDGNPVGPVSESIVKSCFEDFNENRCWLYSPDDDERLKTCRCLSWVHDEQQRNTKWLSELPDCPCSINDLDSSWTTPKVPTCCHDGAAKCTRSKTPTKGGHGQQCCYDQKGQLITGGSAAGTPDYVHPFPVRNGHYFFDVQPWSDCNFVGLGQFYYAYRPPNNGGGKCTANVVNPDGVSMPK